jgi:hypothetical protein
MPDVRRVLLRVMAIAAACVLVAACHSDHKAGQQSAGEVEFGIWTSDAQGELRFVATRDVPWVTDQAFGWRMKSAGGARPVKWVEKIRLPVAPQSWAGVADSPNVTISEDGRTATTRGESQPGDEFIGNVWYVSEGDPVGDYELTVEFEDGRKASFEFRVVVPADGTGTDSPGIIV